jgi:hypothetical protein
VRVAPFVGLTLAIALIGASSAQAGFGCSASAGRLSVLGAVNVEPVTAGGSGDCPGETNSLSGPAAGLPAPLSVGALVAATQVYSAQKAVMASGGIADLAVKALPTLPITLPQVTVPDALKHITVDLSTVKSAIPVLPDPTNLGLNDVRNSIPASVSVDISAALNALLPDGKLPNVELLHVRGAMAYAVGSCQGGSPAVSGQSQVAGISVLGTDVLGDTVDRVVSLIDTASLDPSKVNPGSLNLGLPAAAVSLINSVAPAKTALDAATAAAVAAYHALPAVKVLDPTVAQIKVTPGQQARSGDSITQQALNVTVTIAGQKIVDAVIGEAQASAAGVDCSLPVTDPETPTGATLQCSTRKLVLVDVLERAGRVKLFGVADPALVGKTVSIVFQASHSVVAHARVAKDGSFDTTAALPRSSVRDTNSARYTAVLGKERSINLKLRRRMVIRSMTAHKGRVTIVGRVLPPLGKPVRAITLSRRVSCKDEKVVTRFKPHSDGRFRITVKAPKGAGTAVYRMTTQVRNSPRGHAFFNTYTLPRAVDLT